MSSKGKGKKKESTKKSNVYKIEGDKIIRQLKICPRCGPGIFLADHGERVSCGKCGYTEWKQKK
ncbi:MAG: 30S ribosomal protein S27ae [Candidatus Methanofastidiosa archaeon]|nr:30S ribosomal protein S27ae [Candidatus Methanofastidiosa archaeon]